jgi:hypothetical protein
MMRKGGTMRTTVDIDAEEIDSLARKMGVSRSEAIAAGIQALKERLASHELADMFRRGETHDLTPAPRKRA